MSLPRRALPGTDVPWAWPAPWMQQWRREWLHGDLTAGLVVAVMLVPQSLAYAMLAGLPPQAGLLASLLPLLLYALVGSSSAMSVGPGAITSLMVAQSLAPLARAGSPDYIAMAGVMALGSACLMLLMGVLRMGFLSQLLSRPVVQGFTAASALLILVGQIAPLLGMSPWGATLPDMLHEAWMRLVRREPVHLTDAMLGLAALTMLAILGPVMRAVGRASGARDATVAIHERLVPVWVLMGVAWLASLAPAWGMAPPALVGAVSLSGALAINSDITTLATQGSAWRALLMPTMLLALVGFVSSVSVAQAFALKHGERVDADRELLGLGLANLGSTVLGGMPVSGGLSRSAVNEAAGARSPLAGVISAVLLGAMLLFLLPWLAWLPKAALAAVIIYAIAGLVEWQSLKAAWRYDRADAGAFISTAAGVLLIGFEAGLMLGLAWSLAAMVWRHSQPHVAEVGRLPGTAHYRNVARYEVDTLPDTVMVRVDESLDFTNIQRVELKLCELVHGRSGGQSTVNHVVLLLSAVNHIDHTAVQALVELDKALADQGKTLHLAEVKGFVMDRLKAAGFDSRFAGRQHLSAQEAWDALSSARPMAV